MVVTIEDSPGIEYMKAKDAAQHPCRAQDGPPMENGPASNVDSTKAEKPQVK